MTWMIPDHKLDNDQRQYVNWVLKNNQSVLIQGPAGAGKTVSLVMILNQIMRSNPDKRVCMVLFTHALIDMMRAGIPDDILQRTPIFTTYQFERGQAQKQWDVIIVDEVQDISSQLLDKLFKCAKQVILAGDAAQSIYENGCSMSYFDQITNLQKPLLKKIHRLPKSIQRIAHLFADDPDNFIRYEVSKNVASVSVQLMQYPDYERETQEVWLKAREFAWQSLSTAVIFPKNDDIVSFCNAVLRKGDKKLWDITYNQFGRNRNVDYESLNSHLHEQDVQLQVIGRGAGSMKEADAKNLVSVMTYHSVKGLDFEAVFLPRLIWKTTFLGDPDIARRMFFVALTRSRRNLFLSYYGNAHEFVERIPKDLLSFQEFSETHSDEPNTIDSDDVWF